MSRAGKYPDRPGASPVTASLYASGVIKRGDRVLDIGCGTGSDCLALARWGVADVAGIDGDHDQIETARRRARAFELPPEMFQCLAARDLAKEFDAGSFSIVLDTLCFNNMIANAPRDARRYVHGAWCVLQDGGRIVVVQRQQQKQHWLANAPGKQALPTIFNNYFKLGPTVVTHVPEHAANPRSRPFAIVGITIGQRRARPQSARGGSS